MSKYIVTAGQNIYDVAMHLYGSIEGLLDLFLNNPSLSFSDKLNIGDELAYTDGFVVGEDIVSYNKMHNIIPANSEQHIYFKEAGDVFLEAYLSNRKNSAAFSYSGEGTLTIDWGDNTEMESIVLDKTVKEILHFFNSQVTEKRKIRLSGDAKFQYLDLSKQEASEVYLLRPLYTEKFTLQDSVLNIEFIGLLENDCYQADLTGIETGSLLPLLRLKKLMRLRLDGIRITPSAIDQYLIELVKQYHGRRSCHISLTIPPTGVYKEPPKDENGNYILSCGMEAIWVILHEPSWNEGGNWKFTINEIIYTYEPDN